MTKGSLAARFRKSWERASDRGASAVEYGLMVAAIAAAIVAIVFGFGQSLTDAYHDTCTEIEAHNAATSPDSGPC
jgi:pilus assembly protein Flp/PilA